MKFWLLENSMSTWMLKSVLLHNRQVWLSGKGVCIILSPTVVSLINKKIQIRRMSLILQIFEEKLADWLVGYDFTFYELQIWLALLVIRSCVTEITSYDACLNLYRFYTSEIVQWKAIRLGFFIITLYWYRDLFSFHLISSTKKDSFHSLFNFSTLSYCYHSINDLSTEIVWHWY